MKKQTQEKKKLTKPEHWQEWFEKCAHEKCGPETRNALGNFAYQRYKKYLTTFTGGKTKDLPAACRDLILAEDDCWTNCWRDLEAEYWFSPKPDSGKGALGNGKTYKRFYQAAAARLASAQDARNYLEGSVTSFLIRTRCRKIVSSIIPAAPRSPVKKDGDEHYSNSVHRNEIDQKPGPASESISGMEARRIFDSMSRSERILLFSLSEEIPVTDSLLQLTLELGKSSLAEQRNKCRLRIARELNESEASRMEQGETLKKLTSMLGDWVFSSESGCPWRFERSSHPTADHSDPMP